MSHKTIILKGGLGNQLFQYAHGLKLSLIDKKDVIFDTSFFANTGIDTQRPFLLDKFNIDTQAQFIQTTPTFFTIYQRKIQSYITGNYGFYQHEKYFKDISREIRKQFTLKNTLSPSSQTIAEQIQSHTHAVSLHVRRGDYIQDAKTSAYHGVCDLRYYRAAIDYMKTHLDSPTFFVYSDDIAWAKEHLYIEDVIYVSNPMIPDYEELILMSMCQHNIIANSTFSWWAAYLNQYLQKIVIAPKQWTAKKSSDQLDILPKTWIQL
jgi:Glycosyl transferase family 11